MCRVRPVPSNSSESPYGWPVTEPATTGERAALYAVIAVGGIAGSLARYAVSLAYVEAFGSRSIDDVPWATLAANTIGCLAIGVLATRLSAHSPNWWLRPMLITGVLGGFTTFSAFALETGLLLSGGFTGQAAVYVGATLAMGLIAVQVGRALAGGSR